MTESRIGRAECFEQLNLRGRVDHMVFAADHVCNAKVDIVDYARQRVEISAVRPNQHRVRQRSGIDMLAGAHEGVPDHVPRLELEAPMWLAPLGFEPGLVLLGQLQRRAVIDRGAAARELTLALKLELFGRLVAGINPPCPLQSLDGGIIQIEALRRADLPGPIDAESSESLPHSA